jgi:GH15 family glucan-1,4-alpha-glucosidase
MSSPSRRTGWRRVPEDSVAQCVLLRLASCFDGQVEVEANCLPLFDYGRAPGVWEYEGDGYERLRATYGDLSLRLAGSMRLGTVGARAYGRATLGKGQTAWIALAWADQIPETQESARAQLETTEQYWRSWLSRASVPDHRWRPYIERSALALKGLSYAPTGAVMAAPTTSLPETPGGERNWDYRFTWIRDSAFMLRALHGLGFDWEAFEYFAFLLETITANGGPDNAYLQTCTASMVRPTSPSRRSIT